MIDIKSNQTEINSELYDTVHRYAALDVEVRKFLGRPCEKGSSLEKIRQEHNSLSRYLDDNQAKVTSIQKDPFEICYMLTYHGKDYILDSEVIIAKHRLLG